MILKSSIRLKITLLQLLTLTIGVAAIGTIVFLQMEEQSKVTLQVLKNDLLNESKALIDHELEHLAESFESELSSDDYDAKEISLELWRKSSSSGAVSVALNSKGSMIIQKGVSVADLQTPRFRKLLSDQKDKTALWREITFQGKEFFSLSKDVPNTDWIVLQLYPQEEFQKKFSILEMSLIEPQKEWRTTSVALVLCLAVFLSLVSYHLLNLLVFNRLSELNDNLQKVRRGEMDARLDVKGQDELALISESFNKMTDELSENRSKMESDKDILEEKVQQRTESLKKAKEDADTANISKSQFLANMSHEIRTPMNAILGFTELLSRKMENEEFLAYLNSISASGNTLLRLIDDILDISKVEAGKMELQFSDLDLEDLVHNLEVMYGSLAKDKGLLFKVQVDENLPAQVRLDELRIRQVITNLLSNAVKFTDSGMILLKVSLLEKRGPSLDIAFSVQDTGCGVPIDAQEKIFSEFEQKPGQVQKVYGGTGLGLSICRKLAGLMGGTIELVSEEGAGSEFILKVFDVKSLTFDSTNEKVEGLLVSDGALEGLKILVAEDVSLNRELIKSYLGDTGANLIFADDGVEAIEKARSFIPDLILMDIKMPKMDGMQASTIIKNDSKLSDIPIIVVTASAMKDQVDDILSTCESLITKPVKRDVLIKEICKFLPETIASVPVEENPVKTVALPKTNMLFNDDDLLDLLKKDTAELNVRAAKTMQVNHIQDFIDALSGISQAYDNDVVDDYLRNLTGAYEIFDMRTVEETINEFPKVLEKVT
ncbi:MAG: ATP-binding protein [Lentisphaeraceae bacterium]|nr:ATP-binding protein [Lentisphaeraceae bacterium]